MASVPRRFKPDVPVAISQRCALRLKLLREPELKRQLARLIALYLERCRVRLFGWHIGPANHFHWILSQALETQHDPRGRTGIAAFMRNVSSALAKKINSFYSLQGRVWERPYRSRNLETPHDLLRALAYVHGQDRHHGLPAGSEQHSSAAVYREGIADGLVTSLPAFWNSLGASKEHRLEVMTELMTEIIDRALALADDGEEPGSPWKLATEATLSAHPELDIEVDVTASLDLALTWDLAAEHERARQKWLDWEWPWIRFDPRRAPEPGDIVSIIVDRWNTGSDPPWS